jgi:uncharacterized membrane protein YeaQ/YmgE (transglycosylase-associated protein family)
VAWMVASLVGLFVGLVVSATNPTLDTGRLSMSGLLGVAGAIALSVVGIALGVFSEGDFANFLVAVLGAGIASLAYRILDGAPSAFAAPGPRPRDGRRQRPPGDRRRSPRPSSDPR